MMIPREARIAFAWLLWRDVQRIAHSFTDKLIDAAVWSFNNIIISAYVLPLFGVSREYGPLIWIGTIATMAFFESIYCANDIVTDIATDNVIEYHCTLPLPSWLLFVKIALSAALHSMVLSIMNLPLGYLVLYGTVDLSQAHWYAFAAVFIAMNLFFGFFAVWVASWARDGLRFGYVYRRVVNPLWLFGGYQFSWYVLYNAYPRAALVALLNPILYAFEGLRGAVLGGDTYLNPWICSAMLFVYAILFAVWGGRWMKQRIDAV
jgi:hypothetical protein